MIFDFKRKNTLMENPGGNIDKTTVDSFGKEWSRFDQSALDHDEWLSMFEAYFGIFPWNRLTGKSEGFDMGCGSGRWAKGVAPRVGKLHCVDPSGSALDVSRKILKEFDNVQFHHASVDDISLKPGSQDFGYSLGVLHHIPDTMAALQSCARLLKPGAPFLLYLYYRFDNRPVWYQAIWRMSEIFRTLVKKLPDGMKPVITDMLAAVIYWPLARFSLLIEKTGFNPGRIPLSYYRGRSFYTMRTDSRDRFGTPLEQRFTKPKMRAMMKKAGLAKIEFSRSEPYWVACGIKA